jgi:hypothetical protein
MVLGLGFVIAVDRNRAAWLYCSVSAFNVLMWLYLMGPSASVTVRRDTLDIREAETRIRSANLLGVLVGAAALGWLLFAKPY